MIETVARVPVEWVFFYISSCKESPKIREYISLTTVSN